MNDSLILSILFLFIYGDGLCIQLFIRSKLFLSSSHEKYWFIFQTSIDDTFSHDKFHFQTIGYSNIQKMVCHNIQTNNKIPLTCNNYVL